MEVKEYLQNAEDSMQLAVEYLDDTLSHIRAGKASARLLDGIRVDYYGSQAPISNVANVSVPDARTIAITPWEKSMFKEIEKAIINSELGITPDRRPPQAARQAEQGRGRERQGFGAQRAPRGHRGT